MKLFFYLLRPVPIMTMATLTGVLYLAMKLLAHSVGLDWTQSAVLPAIGYTLYAIVNFLLVCFLWPRPAMLHGVLLLHALMLIATALHFPETTVLPMLLLAHFNGQVSFFVGYTLSPQRKNPVGQSIS